MSLEGPILQSGVARFENAKINLAALGVTISVYSLIWSPIYSIISASNSLVSDRKSYLIVRNFVYLLGTLLVLLACIVVFSSLFDLITYKLMSLTAEISNIVKEAMICLLPAPFFIAYRRFYQGILISVKKTKYIAYGTFVRLISLLVVFIILIYHPIKNSASMAAFVWTLSYLVEAIYARCSCSPYIKEMWQLVLVNQRVSSYWDMCNFYFPLALTSLLNSGTHIALTFFIGHASLPVESLALYPILVSISWFFVCSSLALQELVIHSAGNKNQELSQLGSFAVQLCLIMISVQAVIFLTPISNILFITVYGLDSQLVQIAQEVAPLLLIIPLITVSAVWQRGVLIHAKKTLSITFSGLLELICLCLSMFAFAQLSEFSGLKSALISLIISRTVGCLSLLPAYIKVNNGKWVSCVEVAEGDLG